MEELNSLSKDIDAKLDKFFPQESSIEYKDDSIEFAFIRHLYINRKGSIDDIREKFGENGIEMFEGLRCIGYILKINAIL